jgi:hypothetical protein
MIRRSLLEWYCNHEDYCCLLAAHKCLLPRIWRYENVRERQRLAELEYPRLSQNERKARILDDLYPQLWALYPQLADVLATIPTFKTLDGARRCKAVARLNQQLRQFEQEVQEFMCSPLVEEVLERVEQPVTLNAHHSKCCPPLPFIPYIFRFPPAGFLRLTLFALYTYMHAVYYPILRAEGEHRAVTSEFEDIDKREAMAAAYEQCRSFAGLEDAFGDNQDCLFPCFSPLALAGGSCSPGLRMWLWYKLAHFEKLGQFSTVGIKKHLSVYWNMPNLATEGFGRWKEEPPNRQVRVLSVEDVDLATRMTSIDEEQSSAESEPIGPDPDGNEF